MIYILLIILQSVLLGYSIKYRSNENIKYYFYATSSLIIYLTIMGIYYYFKYDSSFLVIYSYVHTVYPVSLCSLVILALKLNRINSKWFNLIYFFPVTTFFVTLTNNSTGLLFKEYYINNVGKIEFSDGDYLKFNIYFTCFLLLVFMVLLYKYISRYKQLSKGKFLVVAFLFAVYCVIRHTTYLLQDTVDLSVVGGLLILYYVFYAVFYKGSELEFMGFDFANTLDVLNIEYAILNQNNEILMLSKLFKEDIVKDKQHFRAEFNQDILCENEVGDYYNYNNQYFRKKSIESGSYKIILLIDSTEFYMLSKEVEREKDLLIRGISHDIKLPISIIKLNNQIKDRYRLNDDEITQFTNEIMIACDDVESMTKNMSHYLRISETSNDQQPASISEVFDSLSMFKIRETEEVKFCIDKGSDENVKMNSDDLKRVLYNLVDNSFKYTKNGEIRASYHTDEDDVVVEISDTGVGIKESEKDRIFDLFYRSEQVRDITGLGIGLSIVKKIINKHNTQIDVHSKTDVGTRITIKLEKAV